MQLLKKLKWKFLYTLKDVLYPITPKYHYDKSLYGEPTKLCPEGIPCGYVSKCGKKIHYGKHYSFLFYLGMIPK